MAFLREECGFDSAFNYKAGSILDQLNLEAPDGIDVYYDNVGGFGGARVEELPDVLTADHLDVQRFPVRRQLALGARVHQAALARQRVAVDPGVGRILDRAELGEREHGQRQQDHGGGGRPADLQAGVAADLRRDRALARAELDQRVHQAALDQDEDRQRYVERDLVEAVDVLGVGRTARQRGEEGER